MADNFSLLFLYLRQLALTMIFVRHIISMCVPNLVLFKEHNYFQCHTTTVGVATNGKSGT